MPRVIITARAVLDYILSGTPVQPDMLFTKCAVCDEPVTISPDGKAELDRHEGAEVVCTPCASRIVKRGDSLCLTKFAADNMTDKGKEMISAFLKKMES